MKTIMLGGKQIGDGSDPFVIAEVAQAHDGNINFAHAFIDAAADAGADAIKFQTHIAHAETTLLEPWRVKFSRQDETRYAYWKRMEFSEKAWRELADHSAERKLIFLSSPFSLEAVDILQGLDMQAWKIASGEVSNKPLLEKVATTGKPVLLSSGMSPWEELDDAVRIVRAKGCALAVFQCTSSYPCPPERIGLNVLDLLRNRYSCLVGLSDHSATIYSGLAAVALGANFLEVHVTFHRKMFGPDNSSSITFEELAQLVQGCRHIATAQRNPVDKQREAKKLTELRSIFTKSIVARHPLKAGYALKVDDVVLKKPGTGIPASELNSLVGRKLKIDIGEDAQLDWDDFE